MAALIIAAFALWMTVAAALLLIAGMVFVGAYAAWWVIGVISLAFFYAAWRVGTGRYSDPEMSCWLLGLLGVIWITAALVTWPAFFGELAHSIIVAVTR